MNLKKFVNKKSVSKYDYFEIRKTNTTEYKKLSGLELQYLENRFVIYKEKKMDMNDKVHTYVFKDYELYLLIIYHSYANKYQYNFYQDNKLSKTVWYMLESKISLTEYDGYGRKTLRVDFPKSQSEKISGYKYIDIYRDGLSIIEKLESRGKRKLEKIELSLWDLEKYI